jgi:hypothetical protein
MVLALSTRQRTISLTFHNCVRDIPTWCMSTCAHVAYNSSLIMWDE